MKRLRTDEIDTVAAPSSRLSVQQRVAVSTRQDECVAGCFGAWQPTEIDWHAWDITLSLPYIGSPLGPVGITATTQRPAHCDGQAYLLKPDVPSDQSSWTNCC